MSLIICVDFDGTIVEHEYPCIGKPVDGAILYLKRFQDLGAKIILWTMRSHGELNDAVEYIESHGIKLFGVNKNPEQHTWTDSPKAYGQIYIDDAAWGCPLISKANCRPYVNWHFVGPQIVKLLTPTHTNKEDE